MTSFDNLKNVFPSKDFPFKIFYNSDCLLHNPGEQHPERPERIQVIIEGCRVLNTKECIDLQYPDPTTISQLCSLYPEDYLHRVEQTCLSGASYFMSRDNPVGPESFKSILAAGGLAITLGRHLASGNGGFALTRPPGHHAGIAQAEGFCFLNHIALAVGEIRKVDPEARILIADFDVHHGNGTSSIFWTDSLVLFYSIHGSPAYIYPGTGWEGEQGDGAGRGYTLNVPMPLGTSGDEWIGAFESHFRKCAENFGPEYILISAGFDARTGDPFRLMKVEDEHYYAAVSTLIEVTQQCCPGRLGLVLEGGYSLDVLRRVVPNILQQLSSYYNRLH